MEEEKKNMTPEDVAQYLGVNISTIYRYLTQTINPLPSYKITRKNIIIKKEELDSWINGFFQDKN